MFPNTAHVETLGDLSEVMVKASDSIPRLEGRLGRRVDLALNGPASMNAHWRRPGNRSMPPLNAIEGLADFNRSADEFLEKGVELANLVLTLNMDAASVAAALLYRPVRTGSLGYRSDLADAYFSVIRAGSGSDRDLVESAGLRIADTSLLEMTNSRMQTSESRDQIENIKRMLVSMVDDARVAVLKLAERVVALQRGQSQQLDRTPAAYRPGSAHQVFAPLANRLGVWQLKWELEDLSLRYLAPDIYKTIAGQLDGRRAERENEDIQEHRSGPWKPVWLPSTSMRRCSAEPSIIFSIWRKMRAKNVGLQEVYDVRAIQGSRSGYQPVLFGSRA